MDFIKNTLNRIDSQECDTLYDMIYLLFFYAEIEKSMNDIQNNKSWSLEEVEEYLNELEAVNENRIIG